MFMYLHYGWVHPVAHVTMNKYNNPSFETRIVILIHVYVCLEHNASGEDRTQAPKIMRVGTINFSTEVMK
jgi:hypothetical protein